MASAMTIRELLVHLGVTTDSKKLKEFDEGLKYVKEGMTSAAKAAGWLSAGIGGVITGAGLLASQAADTSEMLTQTAETLGITTDALQEYRHVFDQFPVGAGYVAIAFNKVNQQAQNALRGSEALQKAFAAIGLRLGDLRGKQPDQLFEMIADGVAATTDPVKRLDALTQIFGDDLTTKISPALAGGAAGIRQLREQARAYGLVIDRDLIKRGNAAKAQFALLRAVVQSLRIEVGTQLIPVFLSAVNRALDWVKTHREWISLKIEDAVARIEDAMKELEKVVIALDKEVQERFGGWRNLLEQVAKAAVFAAGGRGLLALTRGFVALRMTVVGAKAALATMTPAAASLAATLGVAAAAALGLLLVIDDLAAFARGGDSVIGDLAAWVGLDDELMAALHDLAEAWRELKGTASEFARVLQEELGVELGPIGEFFKGLVKIAVKEWIDDIIGSIKALTSALRALSAAMKGDWAALGDSLGGLRDGLVGNTMLLGTASPTVGLGMQAVGWVADRLRMAQESRAPGSPSITNQSVAFGDTNIQGVARMSVPELEAMLFRLEGHRRRQTMSAFAGGPR